MPQVSDGFWEGATWVYQATIINGAAIATPTCTLTPGEGNEFELYHGTISHNDATASDVDVFIRDDDANTLVNLYDVDSVNQNALCQFPAEAGAPGVNGNTSPQPRRFIIASTMDLFLQAIDIDATEGITVSIVGRIRGAVPTVVETAGGTPTITINTEKVF